MFVNRKVKYKLKRFAWRILKAIVFFGILFSISLTCLCAPVDGIYTLWTDLVDNDLTECYLSNSSGDSFNITPQYAVEDNIAYYYLGSYQNVNYVSFEFFGENLNVKFNKNDVFIFEGIAQLRFSSNQSLDSIKNTFLSFTLSYKFDSSSITYQEFILSSLEDAEFIKGYDYAIIRVPFSFKFSFADSGSIQSLIFEADYLPSYTSHISFKPAQTFQGDKFIYYVGSSQNAPSYSSLDDSQISDLESSQDELLSSFGDDALGDAGGFFEDFWSSRKGSLSNWLGAASELFTVIYNLIPWQISIVITLFLVFGVLTFTINIVGTILTKKSR